MKTVLLKKIRKYWEWRFGEHDIVLRRKVDGGVWTFPNVDAAVTYLWRLEGSFIPDRLIIKHSKRRLAMANKKLWEQYSNIH